MNKEPLAVGEVVELRQKDEVVLGRCFRFDCWVDRGQVADRMIKAEKKAAKKEEVRRGMGGVDGGDATGDATGSTDDVSDSDSSEVSGDELVVSRRTHGSFGFGRGSGISKKDASIVAVLGGLKGAHTKREMAVRYVSHLESLAEGEVVEQKTRVDRFLGQARYWKGLVDEANEITAALRYGCGRGKGGLAQLVL